jgi:fructokinase
MRKKIVCYGEMLWDYLPSGKQPGGAPMNVAFHLSNLQLDPLIISAVGKDELGDELLAFLHKNQLDTSLIQIKNKYPTSTVQANIKNLEVEYDIVKEIAWDYLVFDEKIKKEIIAADLFLYGSLGERNLMSFETLKEILKHAKLKFFDLNLRFPHYTKEKIEWMLHQADFVKMNENEFQICTEWFCKSENETENIAFLIEKYNLKLLCITKGADGASVYNKNKVYHSNGYKVKVKDTIGSGDAFLASIIRAILLEEDMTQSIEFACALGAIVAGSDGATPNISEAMVWDFMKLQTHTNFNN